MGNASRLSTLGIDKYVYRALRDISNLDWNQYNINQLTNHNNIEPCLSLCAYNDENDFYYFARFLKNNPSQSSIRNKRLTVVNRFLHEAPPSKPIRIYRYVHDIQLDVTYIQRGSVTLHGLQQVFSTGPPNAHPAAGLVAKNNEVYTFSASTENLDVDPTIVCFQILDWKHPEIRGQTTTTRKSFAQIIQDIDRIIQRESSSQLQSYKRRGAMFSDGGISSMTELYELVDSSKFDLINIILSKIALLGLGAIQIELEQKSVPQLVQLLNWMNQPSCKENPFLHKLFKKQ